MDEAKSREEIENENPDLQKTVEKDTPLKEWVVDYVGNKLGPEEDEVTLEMIIQVFAEDFPEFLMPIAEENFIRGYQQALNDVEEGEKLMREHFSENKNA
jgi:hypothetical protein|tara:strand:+ start:436 stop:735 length:300 start_codon:yes stop_codon:yes gene_type:complete